MAPINNKSNIPRIMISAAGSGSGKTTITSALLKAFYDQKLKTAAFKAGPDYIDPMFHREVIKIPSRNLDIFLLGKNNCKYVISKNSKNMDISLIEGVMGYYDGIGYNTNGSSYELAKLLDCPVVLVLNISGMSASACAIIEGFKNFREKNNIKGVILNNITKGMYSYYKKLIEQNTNVTVYGYMPLMKNCRLESRHLGLVTAKEVENLESVVKELGDTARQTIDLDGLYELSKTCTPLECRSPDIKNVGYAKIALAYDEAFCFYYEDSLELLEHMGAELIKFSPLRDKVLPRDIDGIYIGGGYPELHMDELSKNITMLKDIKEKAESGMPVFAECGGYMYLLSRYRDDNNRTYKLADVSNGESYMTEKLNHFGYITLTALKDNLMCEKGQTISGHEFHYSSSTNTGESFKAVKPESEKSWNCIIADETKFMGYPHIHLLGNIDLAENYIKNAIEYRKRIRL